LTNGGRTSPKSQRGRNLSKLGLIEYLYEMELIDKLANAPTGNEMVRLRFDWSANNYHRLMLHQIADLNRLNARVDYYHYLTRSLYCWCNLCILKMVLLGVIIAVS